MNIINLRGKITSIKSQIIYINNQGYVDILPNNVEWSSCYDTIQFYKPDERYYNVITNINSYLHNYLIFNFNESFIYLSSNYKNIIGLIGNNGSAIIIKLIFNKKRYINTLHKIETDVKIYNNTIYKKISCFKNGAILLTENGNIEVYNSIGHYRNINIPILKNGEKYISVECGYSHVVLLKNDNTVVAYGWNKYGQCNIPLINDINICYTQIAASPFLNITVLLRNDGKCICIGQKY
jgi:hypothetical protein